MENKETLLKLGNFFKIFADSTRIRILELLVTGKKNVSEIADTLQISQSAISHQLQILRLYNAVSTEKQGQTVTYKIADRHIEIILKYGLEHIKEKENEN